MKVTRACLLFSFVLVFVCLTSFISVSAMNTKLTTEEPTEEFRQNILESITVFPLKEEPSKKGVVCFDVNQNEQIVIVQNGENLKEICVYNAEGIFLYGYFLRNVTSSIGVEWDGENINICFARGGYILSVDQNANVLEVQIFQDTVDNSIAYRSVRHATSRAVNDKTYVIKKNMGVFGLLFSSHSQIVVKDHIGTETIIYDITASRISQLARVGIALILLFMFILTMITIRYKGHLLKGLKELFSFKKN